MKGWNPSYRGAVTAFIVMAAAAALMGASNSSGPDRAQSYIPIVISTTASYNPSSTGGVEALALPLGHGPKADQTPSVFFLKHGHKYGFRVDWVHRDSEPYPSSVKWSASEYGSNGNLIGSYDPGSSYKDDPDQWDGTGKHIGHFGLLHNLAQGNYVLLGATLNDGANNNVSEYSGSVILYGDNVANHPPVPIQDAAPPIVGAEPPPPNPSLIGNPADGSYVPIVITTSAGAGASTVLKKARAMHGAQGIRQLGVSYGASQEFTVGWGGDNLGLNHDPFPPYDVELKSVLFRNGVPTKDDPMTEIDNPFDNDPQWHHKGTVKFLRKTTGDEFILIYGQIYGTTNAVITDHAMAVTVQ